MKINIYNFKNYKVFLKKVLHTSGKTRGLRLKLANHLGCQSGYISQVLRGHVHLSLEHSLKLCGFLELSEGESHYLLLLIQMEKAGSSELKKYFYKQVREIQHDQEKIKNVIEATPPDLKKQQIRYYSSWYYSAIHILTSLQDEVTEKYIEKKLNLKPNTVKEALHFLLQCGFIERTGSRFTITNVRVHLEESSPLVYSHHMNWRLKAMQTFENPDHITDKHYSSVISISRQDAEKVKKIILKALKDSEKILADSKEEELYSLNFDFFKL